MFDKYLEKYKYTTDDDFSHYFKFDTNQRKEFIDDTVKCFREIADTLEKLPPDSNGLKIYFDKIKYVIKEFDVITQQINYELLKTGDYKLTVK